MIKNRPLLEDGKDREVPVPPTIRLGLVIAFALLWAIWIQPHTIALRHVLLTVGSLLGLYVIIQNRSLMRTKEAIPVYLMGTLFLWVTFHLFFLNSKFELQLDEYLTIWKRILWAAPFAIGLGIALGSKQNLIGETQKGSNKQYLIVWWIFYLGIATPTIIYLTRALLMMMAGKFGWTLPNYAMLLPIPSTWHIPKMGYIFFCLPALAIACSQFVILFNQKSRFIVYYAGIYAATILAVFLVFYLENAKNGFAYATSLCLLMLAVVSLKNRFNWGWRNGAILLLSLGIAGILLVQHVKQNDSWRTLFADIKVATQLEEIDAWKDYGARGLPKNEMGSVVSVTNYTRAAWAQVAIQLILERPLGYGLLYQSFGHFAKEKWANSTLDTSHSAWLDLTLAIGIPGIVLVLASAALAFKNLFQRESNSFTVATLWMMLSIFMLMITTEVARQVYIEALFFVILLVAGMGIASLNRFKLKC
ncbi:O-antigen ligase family protein [Polynucleobacter acidiphobus]|uniref:O-antigen ligase family protein n=1 Tax=Polynucleobacter acidiphobus TaxID=556053 RepID=UPI000D3A252E|nr:O-antigen ligase family protein [Polynucleobacter acidiphobus]